jgi:hypothetical protein
MFVPDLPSVCRLSAEGGPTGDELMAEVGRRRHMLRAALSRVTTCGFVTRPAVHVGRQPYSHFISMS